MKLIIFGPPGSGKGTYATRLEAKLNLVPVSTGDLFREAIKAKTELGKKVEGYLNRGELVPDNGVIDVLKERISRPDTEKGFLLDGFPRTIHQAEALDKIANIDAVINLLVPESIIVERLSSRRVCKRCGAIYNVRFLKPKREGICDKCGGELYQRDDDKPAVIRDRLKVYEKQSKPVIDHYADRVPFITVECNQVDVPPEDMVEKILKEIKKKKLKSR